MLAVSKEQEGNITPVNFCVVNNELQMLREQLEESINMKSLLQTNMDEEDIAFLHSWEKKEEVLRSEIKRLERVSRFSLAQKAGYNK